MRSAVAQHVTLWAVFVAGIFAGVTGVFLLLQETHVGFAAAATAGGMTLLGWVMLHPARRVLP